MRRADWFASVYRASRRWLQDCAGNVGMILAISTPAMIMLVGVSVDYARTQQMQTKFQHAVDVATLAMSKMNATYDNPQQAAQRFIEANLVGEDYDASSLNVTVDITQTLNSKSAKITAQLDTPLYFSQLLNIDEFTLGASSNAEEKYQHMEIALVLDTSGSMSSNNRIGKLKDAAEEFFDIMLKTENDVKYTSISVIPYATDVRVGETFAKYIKTAQQSGWNECLDLENATLTGQVASLAGHDERQDQACPGENRQALFLENNVTTLKNHLTGLSTGGWTSADVGAHWGLSSLMPDWKGNLGGSVSTSPKPFSEKVTKIMVIMTDGLVNGPKIYDSGWKDRYGSSFAKNRFAAICETAKTAGVRIYTIGFEVPSQTMLDVLKTCASEPKNYFETSGTAITDAFKTIAYSLVPLRLTN